MISTTSQKLPFFTLLLMISFASVNAVLFTPGLPSIEKFFSISTDSAQMTISWFLIGYALGQLLYGPLANRYGRKKALYAGILLQIVSSLLCVLSGYLQEYTLLIIGRFLLALGSGVGLKMTFTLVNECYEPKLASQKISYLILGFAITPGLGVAIGGLLTEYWGWMSCFYVGALYGFLLLLLVSRLPETLSAADLNALKFSHLFQEYAHQFKNRKLVMGALMMGCSTAFIYLFAAIAPFVAINQFGMSSAEYGFANFIPPIGLVMGSFVSGPLAKRFPLEQIIRWGIMIAGVGVALMLAAVFLHLPVMFTLFLPMIIILFGLCFLIANASTVAMAHVSDKAHGSAVLNFLNMGLATVVVLSLRWLPMNIFLMPELFVVITLALFFFYRKLTH